MITLRNTVPENMLTLLLYSLVGLIFRALESGMKKRSERFSRGMGVWRVSNLFDRVSYLSRNKAQHSKLYTVNATVAFAFVKFNNIEAPACAVQEEV